MAYNRFIPQFWTLGQSKVKVLADWVFGDSSLFNVSSQGINPLVTLLWYVPSLRAAPMR